MESSNRERLARIANITPRDMGRILAENGVVWRTLEQLDRFHSRALRSLNAVMGLLHYEQHNDIFEFPEGAGEVLVLDLYSATGCTLAFPADPKDDEEISKWIHMHRTIEAIPLEDGQPAEPPTEYVVARGPLGVAF